MLTSTWTPILLRYMTAWKANKKSACIQADRTINKFRTDVKTVLRPCQNHCHGCLNHISVYILYIFLGA
jgi:hypothetical protein